MKYGVQYPISGVHACPFGRWQAEQIQFLAIREGIDAVIVVLNELTNEWEYA